MKIGLFCMSIVDGKLSDLVFMYNNENTLLLNMLLIFRFHTKNLSHFLSFILKWLFLLIHYYHKPCFLHNYHL